MGARSSFEREKERRGEREKRRGGEGGGRDGANVSSDDKSARRGKRGKGVEAGKDVKDVRKKTKQFSNLEQLLEVRAACRKYDLVCLQTSAVAGERDVDEIFVIPQSLELAGYICLKVVPTQAELLLLAIRHYYPRCFFISIACLIPYPKYSISCFTYFYLFIRIFRGFRIFYFFRHFGGKRSTRGSSGGSTRVTCPTRSTHSHHRTRRALSSFLSFDTATHVSLFLSFALFLILHFDKFFFFSFFCVLIFYFTIPTEILRY